MYDQTMKQVLIIHGGESFSSYDAYINDLRSMQLDYERLKPRPNWKQWVVKQLPNADVLLLTFPNGYNAVYDEWKIYFEKILPFLDGNVPLVGHSLGAMFLAKYLHKNVLSSRVEQIILIAGRYRTDDENHGGGFIVKNASGVERSSNEVHLFHSEDDPVVEYESLSKFAHDIPGATVHSFTDRGHFLQETFPELLELLK